MLGFDTIDLFVGNKYVGTQWRVYELYGSAKHYLNGYASYEKMLADYPKLS